MSPINPSPPFLQDRKSRSTTRSQSLYTGGETESLKSCVTETLIKDVHEDIMKNKYIIPPVVLTSKGKKRVGGGTGGREEASDGIV